MKRKTIAVLGAGSFGTAMAVHLTKAGHQVLLWAHRKEHVAQMLTERSNSQYLPGILLPESITPTNDLTSSLQEASTVIIAVPSHAFSTVLQQFNVPIKSLAWLTKGVDPKTNAFFSDIVAKQLGADLPIAVISGPSFAKEIAAGLPTALTVASNHDAFQKTVHQLIHHGNIRVYSTDDVVGVQLCGAVKNVLAIACGVSDGLHFGANAKAALITRGLAEMSRLGTHLSARKETFLGLSGVGDLVLTCTDNQSRNRRFGLLLGNNISISDAQGQIGQVVEGVHNAQQICELAQSIPVEMPICQQVYALLDGKATASEVVHNLMNRPAKDE